ncbi:vegetative incompatibility protein HET-E-1 [Trichoderma asperellum]|uniref:Vegetative incompatibility protein HET-E-1 n=1 Tax=Trichoderma asperellum TaxID=101201 RepID=A0A6V8R2V7_TRIAP|nr:vegetative incompatibility protein HET-E-1 [Trichoderma asperellum]
MADPHNRSCLKALQTTDPREDKERIEKSNGGLFRDSCLWILDNFEFKQWRSHPKSNLLWIKGDPGKGKTMLLSSIINELSSTADSGRQEACTLSYFFCQASDLRTNNAGAVLRGLIYMLADRQPVLLSHARKRYDHVGDQLFTDSNSLEALSKIFSAIIQDRRLNDTYVVIDALDECIRDREFLTDLIAQLSATNSKIKWLVSSRNLPSIEEGFTMAQKLELSLELNDKFISTALGIYVQHKVAELAIVKGYTEDMQAAIHHYLYSNASSSFLWVALVCQDLAKIPTQSNILLNLTEFPARLDALYTYMLDQICGSDMAKLCLHILAITSVVYRPITVDELSSFIDMHDGTLDEKTLMQAIGLCSSFLTIQERTILFIHQSAKDFLIGNATNTVFAFGMEHIHYVIFSQSLQVLPKTLRRDIYGLDAPGFPIDQIKQPDPDPLAAARQHGDLHDGGTVDTFLRTKYLYWLESLSLLNSLPEGALSISKLQHLLQEKANAPYFLETQSNTHGKANKSQLADLVYTSALVFSPPDSLIKNLFTHEEPRWIVTKPNVDDEGWIPGVQTLKGHGEQVYSMVFSPDGVWLASVSVDGTVQIWNLETGHCQQTLHVHRDSVYSVAFLPNSNTLIISGMEDNSIQVWDTVTNQMLQTLKGHGDTIRAIEFSPSNNDLLASGSWDHTVRIWDLATSSCLQTLQGHDGDVCTIAFSPDGVRLASGSSDRTIKVWDPVNGFCLHTLYRHNVASTAITFTPDGSKLVSALSNDGVAIWDLATGQCLHTVFVGTPLRKLTFDVTGSFLHTDRGSSDPPS